MKTIRGKLLVYFFVFIFLFQITAISIFVSSNELTNTYNDSFQRFLLLNKISQNASELYTATKSFVNDSNTGNSGDYFEIKANLEDNLNRLSETFYYIETIEMKNYINLIETFIHETGLTIGFVLRDDTEQYMNHLEEAGNASDYISESTLEIIRLELTAYQSFYDDLQLRNNNFILFIVFLFLTTILLAVFFAIWFSKGITRPLEKLSAAAEEVASGELQGEPIHIRTNDELRLLGDTFNQMRAKIHDLFEEVQDQSELDRLVKEMELKHLQNQVNPHFLFNTLNTISKMAYMEEAKSTSGLIDSASALLRHSLGEIDHRVPLKDEVKVVQDYFHIQKIRFSERVTFHLEIDERCLDIEVPQLTLQPLVENAFIHGIEGKEEGGTISLVIYQKHGNVIVEVRDDGVGMGQSKMDQIISLTRQQQEGVGHSTGIGLTNVIRRLELVFRENHRIEMDSEPGKGTVIRIILPYDKEGRE
ncbi:Histidine kinase-, DNA gyrase B-, and HSP90-like ATPase [Lentibacillus halodurans]|uniref:histidine kinase n=1 Tax=Lentibacillus halodurans TaxID=237679 RepID=A0A1I0XKU7_9BACI|nr:sensor histidine kinase [Lentibacillus halodurans]SFB01749.1 Histidine kinase-, DNA gyrase B-, and HSP90-like ATPase [Lentibacillus halodurans]